MTPSEELLTVSPIEGKRGNHSTAFSFAQAEIYVDYLLGKHSVIILSKLYFLFDY